MFRSPATRIRTALPPASFDGQVVKFIDAAPVPHSLPGLRSKNTTVSTTTGTVVVVLPLVLSLTLSIARPTERGRDRSDVRDHSLLIRPTRRRHPPRAVKAERERRDDEKRTGRENRQPPRARRRSIPRSMRREKRARFIHGGRVTDGMTGGRRRGHPSRRRRARTGVRVEIEVPFKGC